MVFGAVTNHPSAFWDGERRGLLHSASPHEFTFDPPGDADTEIRHRISGSPEPTSSEKSTRPTETMGLGACANGISDVGVPTRTEPGRPCAPPRFRLPDRAATSRLYDAANSMPNRRLISPPWDRHPLP